MPVKLQHSKIPQSPGVYFFSAGGGSAFGGKNKILYIGKAANLRARLRYYANFKDAERQNGRPTFKILALLQESNSLSWEILNSETEALIREAELIKKYRPKYNILMRDDKQYFFVGFTKEKFPKIFITHQPKSDFSYIGPFTDGGALRNVLQTLRRAFPYCTCKHPHKRLCLNAKIGRCLGFCCSEIPEKQMQPLRSFSPSQRWTPKLQPFYSSPCSETMLKRLQKSLRDSSAFPSPPLLTKERGVGGEVYQKNIRSIKQILSGKNRSLAKELKKEMNKLSDAQKYEEAGKIRNQIRALEKVFEHRVVIKQDLPTESVKALRSLESLLKISSINKIEAYDIANIHGKLAYGSMAVFQNGQIKKDAYRLFKIKTVRGSNDPAMIKEVLERRFKHPEWQYPDVIIVDGGKAQLGAALGALPRAQALQDLAQSRHGGTSRAIRQQANMRVLAKPAAEARLIALTKNRHHVGDHVFIQNHRKPIPLTKLPPPLKNLILLLDSEAHRFAISHYRRLHRKSLLT